MYKQTRNILVIDDDEYLLDIIQNTLESEGFSVSIASEGSKALESFDRNRPDLVILDIKMPGLNGYDILQHIRKTSDVPVIMLTGIIEPEIAAQAIDLGANDYIRKPFIPREVVARVRAKLRRVGP